MAGITAQGATFRFLNVAGTIVSIQIETPSAEIVDMTGGTGDSGVDSAEAIVLVPTGAFSGGAISVDYIMSTNSSSQYSYGVPTPKSGFLGKAGPLSFACRGFSVTRQAILENVTVEARVNDIVRGTLRFRLTDYTATGG